MPRLPPALERAAGLLVDLGLVLGGLVALLGLAAAAFPLVDGVNHFQVLWALASLGLLLIALASRDRIRIQRAAWIAALHAFLFLAPVLRLPAWSAGSGPGTPFKILSLNAYWYNTRPERVAELVLAESPDVVVLQELREAQGEIVNRLLRDAYPYRLICAGREGCDGAIFARRPWLQAHTVTRGEEAPPSTSALFDIGNGRRLRVIGTHMWNPRNPRRQLREIEWLGSELGRIGDLKIVAGDFNLTPWSFALSRFERRAGVVRGDGIAGSWRASRYLPAIFPIDHVFASPEIRFTSVRRGPWVGSDHLPTIATMRLP